MSTEGEKMDLLLKNMQTMQEQMKAMQKGQEETCMRLARQSHKDSYVFKKKGNECQFKAKEEVKERLEVADGYLDRVEAASGKEQLDLAKKELGTRLKKEIAEDVFASGVWPLLSNLEDPELRRLAKALPATVLGSRADSTTKKYLGAYQRWKVWADARQGVPSFPVHERHLVLYLQHLSESTGSKAAVEEAVHALSWLHELAWLQQLGGSPLVKCMVDGLKRILAKPKVRKEPVTADMLKAMVEAAGPDPPLSEVRLLAVCLVAFAGFLRW
eukprot:Em0003g1162a